MTVDPAVLPGLLLLAAELAVLAAVGYIVVRVALRQDDELSALAQGLVVGPALWGITVNFVMYAVPGLAGAAVGWGVTLMLGAALAWRSPGRVRVSARTVAGFTGVVLVLGWVALASRQLLPATDIHASLGLAASIRAGGFPVSLPWHPEATASYHYGASLLAGLLMPPDGPDLAFVWELLGAYAWVSFALVVGTALGRRGSSLIALTLAPLLLGYGLTTYFWIDPGKVAGILSIPMPVGVPAAGLRAALADIYWAAVEPVGTDLGSLPDIWKPQFPLGYATAFVILAQAARHDRATWLGSLTLAGLVGFLGLLVTTLTPVVVVVWVGLEAFRLLRIRRAGGAMPGPALRSAAGPAAAGLLLLFGGGALSGVVGSGAGSSGLTWTASLDVSHWAALGGVEARQGGVGLLVLGPLAVAGAAVVFARRDRLVLALAAGTGLFALAWLALDYPPRPFDIDRLAGHARNLALVALLLALGQRLAGLPGVRWRYAAVTLLIGLVVWPTVGAPVRSLVGAVGHGVQLANADRADRAQDATSVQLRQRMPTLSSEVATAIRTHTSADARVLDPSWDLAVLLNTGRPNNKGFADVIQLSWRPGPEYLDARYYLEPGAFRRLGLVYVYATDAWVAELPGRARNWLADPGFFELLVRDGSEALYRVRPAFLALRSVPHPDSFEALRTAVPPGAVVYLVPQRDSGNQASMLSLASTLSRAQLVGAVNPVHLALRTSPPWPVAPLGAHVPEYVALPLFHEAWLYPPAGWHEVWRHPPSRVAVYVPPAAGAQPAEAAIRPVLVQVADVRAEGARLTFTATLDAPGVLGWSGQDWVLAPIDPSPLGIPAVRRDGRPLISQWFAGQAAAGAVTTHTYVFDALASTLGVRGSDGAYSTAEASKRTSKPGAWMLALRLTRRGDQGIQGAVVIAPVLRVDVSASGAVSYLVYDTASGWQALTTADGAMHDFNPAGTPVPQTVGPRA